MTGFGSTGFALAGDRLLTDGVIAGDGDVYKRQGLYRKDGDARVPVKDPDLQKVLKERANEYMSPFMMRKIVMSNAFW